MKNKVIGFLTVFIAVPLACYAHAGFYDRFLEMMDVLYDILKTIIMYKIQKINKGIIPNINNPSQNTYQ